MVDFAAALRCPAAEQEFAEVDRSQLPPYVPSRAFLQEAGTTSRPWYGERLQTQQHAAAPGRTPPALIAEQRRITPQQHIDSVWDTKKGCPLSARAEAANHTAACGNQKRTTLGFGLP